MSSRHPFISRGKSSALFRPLGLWLEWPLQGSSLGDVIWRPCATHTTCHPHPASSRVYWQDPAEYTAFLWRGCWLHELLKNCQCCPLRVFMSGYTSIAFSLRELLNIFLRMASNAVMAIRWFPEKCIANKLKGEAATTTKRAPVWITWRWVSRRWLHRLFKKFKNEF